MNHKADDLVYSKGIIEFLTVAHEYCLFTEKAGDYSAEDVIQYYVKICPLIYLKGILLPEMEENDSEITERYVTEELWESTFLSLKMKLGNSDIFQVPGNDERTGNLLKEMRISENLTDVYQDLKDFVMLYQKSTQAAKENAVYECRRLFQTHWGRKILQAQGALHDVLYPNQIQQEQEDQVNIDL